MTNEEEGSYTLEEVGVILKCSKRTVSREISAGRLSSMKFGHNRRVLAEDLRSYIEQHKLDCKGPATTIQETDAMFERTCLLVCGQRRPGDPGGIAFFFLDSLSASHVCDHVLASLGGVDRGTVLQLGWADVMDGIRPGFIQYLVQLRRERARYVIRLPFGGTEMEMLNAPILDPNGQILHYLTAAGPVGAWANAEVDYVIHDVTTWPTADVTIHEAVQEATA